MPSFFLRLMKTLIISICVSLRPPKLFLMLFKTVRNVERNSTSASVIRRSVIGNWAFVNVPTFCLVVDVVVVMRCILSFKNKLNGLLDKSERSAIKGYRHLRLLGGGEEWGV